MILTRRLPVYLLLDTSGSMSGDPINALRQGLRLLISDLKSHPEAVETAYLSVITFDNVASQVIPLTGIMDFKEPALGARGSTCLGEALKLLQDCYDNERKIGSATEKGDYKPLVFLMTDGRPTDEWERISDEIGEQVRKGQRFGKFVALGAGSAADTAVLKRITDDVMVIHEIRPELLKSYFAWISSSIVDSSKNVDSSSELPPPPIDFEIVP